MRVLIAVDGSECSSMAVDSVADRHWPDDTEFLVINVIEPVYYDYAFPNVYIPSLDEAQKEYQAYCNDLVITKEGQIKKRHPHKQIAHKVLDGFVADTIVDEAKDWGADLIVLGSHGRKGIQKFLLGSVAEKVAVHSPCSVEIVKQKERAASTKEDKQKATVS